METRVSRSSGSSRCTIRWEARRIYPKEGSGEGKTTRLGLAPWKSARKKGKCIFTNGIVSSWQLNLQDCLSARLQIDREKWIMNLSWRRLIVRILIKRRNSAFSIVFHSLFVSEMQSTWQNVAQFIHKTWKNHEEKGMNRKSKIRYLLAQLEIILVFLENSLGFPWQRKYIWSMFKAWFFEHVFILQFGSKHRCHV